MNFLRGKPVKAEGKLVVNLKRKKPGRRSIGIAYLAVSFQIAVKGKQKRLDSLAIKA
jgi:hypothetical protein